MTELTVSLPLNLQTWLDARLAEGEYADAGEFVRELLRRDRASATSDRLWLKAMVDEGLASGDCEEDALQVIDRIIAEMPDRNG